MSKSRVVKIISWVLWIIAVIILIIDKYKYVGIASLLIYSLLGPVYGYFERKEKSNNEPTKSEWFFLGIRLFLKKYNKNQKTTWQQNGYVKLWAAAWTGCSWYSLFSYPEMVVPKNHFWEVVEMKRIILVVSFLLFVGTIVSTHDSFKRICPVNLTPIFVGGYFCCYLWVLFCLRKKESEDFLN